MKLIPIDTLKNKYGGSPDNLRELEDALVHNRRTRIYLNPQSIKYISELKGEVLNEYFEIFLADDMLYAPKDQYDLLVDVEF